MSPSLEPAAMASIVVKRMSRASAAGVASVAAAAMAWQKSFGLGGAAEGSVGGARGASGQHQGGGGGESGYTFHAPSLTVRGQFGKAEPQCQTWERP